MSDIITSYKGFNKDMTCRGFQYEEGKEYEEDSAEVCDRGFHACEYPLDCFKYYNPAESVFHEVEQSGDFSRNGDDSKVASTKIKIGASINIAGLVKAAIEYTTKKQIKRAAQMKTMVHPLLQGTRVHPLLQGTVVHPLLQGTRESLLLATKNLLLLHGGINQEQKVS